MQNDKYIIEKTVNYRRGMERLIPDIQKYDAVIIGDMPSHERNVILKYCFQNSIRSYCVPKISDILLKSSNELNLFDSPLLLSRNMGLSIEQLFIKRVIDIIGSAIGIVITLPFFVIIGICIKLTDGGPVIYKQTRLTKDGRPFEIYKFRTMIQNAEKDDIPRLAAEGDPRILPIGRLLRRTRLDELPQIYNILKGDMSLVGPRPERPELVEEFTAEIPEFPSRMKVKAGLTGYAQVYGKYNTTPYDKLKLDLTYIRNYSVFLDLKLIFMTPKILFSKGKHRRSTAVKKALLVTTVSGFVPQFEMNNVRILQQMGYEVHYASNYHMPSYGNDNSRLDGTGIIRHQVDFERSPFTLKNIAVYKQLKKVMEEEQFDLVHCHTPMGGALARIAAHNTKTGPVLYTAHGFHFFKGAPLVNWLCYYPVEKMFSHYTDVLICINQEDYERAKKKFYAKQVIKIPGVGIDIKRIENIDVDRNKKREDLGIGKDQKVLLFVGEMTKNKNHRLIIEAVAKLHDRV